MKEELKMEDITKKDVIELLKKSNNPESFEMIEMIEKIENYDQDKLNILYSLLKTFPV